MLKDAHEIEVSTAENIEDQLPTQQIGDKLVVDPAFLQKQAWYQRCRGYQQIPGRGTR